MAFKRQVIMPPGRTRLHSPVPEGMRCGDWLFSSLLGPTAGGGVSAGDPVGDARLLFKRINDILEAAGGTPDNLVHLGVYVLDDEDRQAINVAWSEMFPDGAGRPARYILNVDPEGTHWRFAAQFTAVLGDNLGKAVFSPMITGKSTGSNQIPSTREQEVDVMFEDLKGWVENAGASLANVASVMVYCMQDDGRQPLNAGWAKTFPDTTDLPCRQTLIVRPDGLQEGNFGAFATAIL